MSLHSIRPWRDIPRRKSRQIMVGNVPVGGDAPITVQTMTNTLTTDVAGTIAQVQAAADAGADIVRISVPDEASSKALREIVREVTVPMSKAGWITSKFCKITTFTNLKSLAKRLTFLWPPLPTSSSPTPPTRPSILALQRQVG